MAELTAKSRKHMKPSTFGLPDKKAYPMPDKSHAVDAKGRATQMLAKGKLTPEQAAKIRHKADVVLGETDSTHHGN